MQRPILIILILAVACVIIFARFAYKDNLRTKNTQLWINDTHEIIKSLDDIATTVSVIESNVRGYAITNDSTFIADYTRRVNNINRALTITQKLINDNQKQITLFLQLKKYVRKKLALQQKIIIAKKETGLLAAQLMSGTESKTLMDSIMGMLVNIKNIENSILQEHIRDNRKASQRSLNKIIIGGGLMIVFVVIILINFNHGIQLRQRTEKEIRKSERKYRQFIENSRVVTFTTDIRGHFTFISPQVSLLTGYNKEDLLGKHFSVLVRPDWVRKVMNQYINQYVNRIKETSLTFPIQRKDKTTRWVEQDAILLIIDQKQKTTAFHCVVKDITEKIIAEEKLKQVEEDQRAYQFRLQAILDNTPLIIYVKDLEGKYTLVNKQFKETLKLEEEDILGKTVYELKNLPAEWDYVADKKVMETLQPMEMEDVIHLDDGPHYVLTVKFPLFNQHKQLFGVCGIVKDITTMVKYREELIAARQEAENAEILQEQFLANMSHEIRTPMNGIMGMTNLLLNTKLSKQQQEYIQLIKQSADNLLILINDILDLSKIKAGKITIEQIPFNLKEVIQPLATGFRLRAIEKGIEFSLSIDPNLPAEVQGDPYRLTQILNNLVGNALKFTEKGAVKVIINQHVKEEDIIDISFTITDSGIGIDEKQLDHIFEGFAQASSYITRKFGGTGLGLAITKKLIEMQGGIINVSSKPGKGSTFFFVLPFVQISAEASAEPMQKFDTNIEQQTYEGKKILIVEDNEINQKVLQFSLERHKVIVAIASNGEEAIRILEKDPQFDLILMDLRMPKMDGYQTTDYIRNQLSLNIPIVILTASALQNERQKTIELGANEYVTKPFSPKHLEDCLYKYLSGENSLQKQISTIKKNQKGKLYDLSLLFEMEDPESIKAIYDLFKESVPAGLEKLKQCILREDWKEVYEQAHKLKSSLSVIQIDDVRNGMNNIEENSKKEKNVKEVLQIVNRSIKKIAHVIPMIKLEVEKQLN